MPKLWTDPPANSDLKPGLDLSSGSQIHGLRHFGSLQIFPKATKISQAVASVVDAHGAEALSNYY